MFAKANQRMPQDPKLSSTQKIHSENSENGERYQQQLDNSKRL